MNFKKPSITVKRICPHCGHNKAFQDKPKICARCKKENKGLS